MFQIEYNISKWGAIFRPLYAQIFIAVFDGYKGGRLLYRVLGGNPVYSEKLKLLF